MKSFLLGFLLWLFVIPSWGQLILPSQVFSGQQTATATPTPLSSAPLYNGVVITALSTNTAAVYVGPCVPTLTTSNGYPLAVALQSIAYAVTNAASICLLGASGGGVSWTGN